MRVDIKVPALSESVAQATLLSWHKKEGEHVERDENLIDVETDKVVMELPAPATGTLAKIIKGDGATVTGGEVIAMIDTEAGATKDNTPAASTAAPSKSKVTESGAAPSAAEARPAKKEAEAAPPSATAPASTTAAEVPGMMPAAQKLAAQENLAPEEIRALKGSGRDGRITKEDVAAYVEQKRSTANIAPAPSPAVPQVPAAPPPSPAPPVSPAPESAPRMAEDKAEGKRSEKRVPMSRLRARIAERLVQSQSTAAILTTFNEVNMQAIMDLRARYKDKFEKEHGVKLGLTSFFVKAAVAALKKFPIVNASVDGNDIVYHEYYDIGIAVSSARGLVVPIIRNADSLSQAEIERQVTDFGRRAQDGKLTIEELTGGTFSITNGGVFGSMLSTPIINPPQSAILGIHATKERPVVENGQIVIRPICYLALSYDHRIIDGREAVLSLVAMKEALEYPMSPLLES
ncbi:2-oxoglutarate dehydrogenase E2 component [Nitrosospira multiformis ATCC 25196]|uniref:Dihydrolipoyllysine-residue succinyltransferase component of 2-oxoglutarate dehydrogenase complex n=1 Tax=Nitrosospira multiformis (strain ATCC 25196 / NCIMB 11849 / C 71) TaxID=323848 RepID=Q2YAR2_NITMU|nr:2-oxoglutarate dehydrogenase complex dihydrolipoyllysine-residue succinyltransferase [Nitrosospira multiformis]ABB74159.1 2-oxoglutarate dehydrogenase E2 component [Nitrosospira multiformis ATCC 25196]SEF46285.1 2-oxoglutarate dehydrogenase E2 component [Nitrosospira multiformis ATCC 25196]